MSSVSQEDLDARRERADAVATAAQAVPSNAESVPPESITVEKTQGPRESLVVPVGSQTSTPQIEPRAFVFEPLAPVSSRLADDSNSSTAPESTAATSRAGRAATSEIVGPRSSTAMGDAVRTESADVAASRIMQRVDGRLAGVWLDEHRRAVCLAAAVLGFLIAFFGFRGNNGGERVELSRTSKVQSSKARVAPAVSVSNATEQVLLLAPVVISEPASVAMRESFFDAFVRHAASVNSSWAEVKKRSKHADVQSTNRPGSHAASAPSENPLNVLEQLEKARKAKRRASSTP